MTARKNFFALALSTLAILAGGRAHAQPEPPTAEHNRQFIAKAFARWAAGGTTFYEDVLAPDMVWTIKGTSPMAGRYEGRDAFVARAVAPFTARLSSSMQPTVKHIWAEDDHVVVQWDGAATAADGQPYRNSYVWIFRMENLRATEVTAYLDMVPYDEVLQRIPLD
jgi:ketosteroid isomerase-like protein